MVDSSRIQQATEQEFKELLKEGHIRPASLEDVHGTQHKRLLFRHPRTDQWYVMVPNPNIK